ncbi:MAG: hypothetical protein GY778_13935 [bacterium]|nr:hypothetical protein [bacterium]
MAGWTGGTLPGQTSAGGDDVFVAKLVSNAEVVDRRIFYNNSAFDGTANQPPNAGDNGAVAPSPAELTAQLKDPTLGKTALLPGQTATFQNYISCSNGINGIMIDVEDLAYPDGIDATDFTFNWGNNPVPAGWSPANTPKYVDVLAGAGLGGSAPMPPRVGSE